MSIAVEVYADALERQKRYFESELIAYKEMCEKLALNLKVSVELSEHACKGLVSSILSEYENFKKERE